MKDRLPTRKNPSVPIQTDGYVKNIALADIDGDGSLEMVAGSNDARVYIWKISNAFGDLEWPMIRQNLCHTGTVDL
jgi:hypothetical protein